jgi:hypothetical protein
MTRHAFQQFFGEASTQQPGGLPEISRGLSGAIPPENIANTLHPEWVQEAIFNNGYFCDPSRVVSISRHFWGCRRVAPQPPANFWQAFGLRPK